MIDLSGRRYDTGATFAPAVPPPPQTGPNPTAPTPGIPMPGVEGPGVQLTDEQHKGNFVALYNIDPALAYDYTYRTPSSQQWWQKNQSWIAQNFFGGDELKYNAWLNDSSHHLNNFYTSNPQHRGLAQQYATGQKTSDPFFVGSVASHFEPGKWNPYASSGAYQGSTVPGGTPFQYGGAPTQQSSVPIQREPAPSPGVPPISFGGTIPREPASAPTPTVTAPAVPSTASPHLSAPTGGYRYRHAPR